MSHIRLIIAYDGSPYCGWQDNSSEPSVERALREVLEQILQEKLELEGASRTDTGVHAEGQVVCFHSSKTVDLGKLQKSCNSLLPPEIRVLNMDEVADDFHPTLDSKSKEYHYQLCYDPVLLPSQRHSHWHYPYKLDIESMRAAAQELLGSRDFKAFCNANPPATYDDTVRTLKRIDIIELPRHCLRVEIEGDHFLYKMVRNIVGTLAQIGRGYLPTDTVKKVLETGDRTQSGMTAAAHGLTLKRINY